MSPIARVGPVVLLSLVLTACGVALREKYDGTEVFGGISLVGERRAGQELTVSIQVSQVYPVPVRIDCYYEDGDRLTADQQKMTFEERARYIGGTVLEPDPRARPEKHPPRKTLAFPFVVPGAGSYFVACLTPAATENGWGMDFKVAP